MDPGPFIALAFVSPALVFVVGALWLGGKYLRRWGERKDDLRAAIERLEIEMDELQERVDFHERVLQQHRDSARLEQGG